MPPRVDRLLDDGELRIDDVRCDASPDGSDAEERARRTEVVIPLRGAFVRVVRRVSVTAGRREATSLLDPTVVSVFRPDEAYRVLHPVGGGDRSLVLGLADGIVAGLPTQAVGPMFTTLAMRLARGLRDGTVDALTAADVATGLVQRLGAPGTDSGAPDPVEPEPAEVRETRLAIAADPGTRATLPELGRSVGRSGWELARRFRRATGTSIHRYRTALRIRAALERVEAGERDLTALALDLGFADHAHLAATVRRVVGAPPSAFRRAATAAELRALRTILQAGAMPPA